MDPLAQLFASLLTDTTVLGGATFAILAWVYHNWQVQRDKELPNVVKAAIALVAPYFLVTVVYFIGWAIGLHDYRLADYQNALRSATEMVLGAKFWHTIVGTITQDN